jgi:hypothetical protein
MGNGFDASLMRQGWAGATFLENEALISWRGSSGKNEEHG